MRSYTILYVDDDIDDLLIISDAFEKYTDHLNVIHASNGREGLTVLDNMHKKETMPCLLIIDINMPIMDGKELLKKVRQQPEYENLPVIMFSTSQSAADKEFAEKYNADFFTKPGSYTRLKTLVDAFVTKCKLEVTGKA